jgi:hypothetical protein
MQKLLGTPSYIYTCNGCKILSFQRDCNSYELTWCLIALLYEEGICCGRRVKRGLVKFLYLPSVDGVPVWASYIECLKHRGDFSHYESNGEWPNVDQSCQNVLVALVLAFNPWALRCAGNGMPI